MIRHLRPFLTRITRCFLEGETVIGSITTAHYILYNTFKNRMYRFT